MTFLKYLFLQKTLIKASRCGIKMGIFAMKGALGFAIAPWPYVFLMQACTPVPLIQQKSKCFHICN